MLRLVPITILLFVWLTACPVAGQRASGDGAEETPPAGSEPTPGEDGSHEDGAFEATAMVEREVSSTTELDATAAGTRVSLDDRPLAGETARDVLAEVPGAQVQSSGGQGAFTGLSLRGADPHHTTVVLDDLIIHGPDDGAYDFSLLPLAAFSAIEVYRGGAPAQLDVAPLGGTVRLIPRSGDAQQVAARIDYGSFRTGGLTAHAAVGDHRTNAFGVVGLRGTAGAFRYLDDGNTRFDYTDDVVRRRQNAEVFDAQTMLLLRFRPGQDWRFRALVLGISRQAGTPGPASAPALQATIRRKELRLVLGADRCWYARFPGQFTMTVSAFTRRQRFHDALAEVGLGRQSTDDRTRGWSLRAAALVDWHPNIQSTSVVSARGYHYAPEDVLARLQEGSSRRESVSATTEIHFHGAWGPVAWALRPSVRLTGTFGRSEDVDGGRVRAFEASEFAPTYRLGVGLSPTSILTLTGSVYRGVRLPSLLELFGDRSTLLPNAELRPETGRGGDVGVRLSLTEPGYAVHAEARAFSGEITNLIRYRRTSQFQAVADNVERGRLRGLEAALSVRVSDYARFSSALSLLDARDGQDRVLPLRASRRVFARLELGTDEILGPLELRAFVDLRHQSRVFADPANLVVIPSRTWTTVGASALLYDLRLDFTVRDVLDRAGFDLIGFPLPGRRVAVMLTYQKDWP